MYLLMPRMELRTDCRMDRHVRRLERARGHLHAALPLAPLAEPPRHRLVIALKMLVILRVCPIATPGEPMLLEQFVT